MQMSNSMAMIYLLWNYSLNIGFQIKQMINWMKVFYLALYYSSVEFNFHQQIYARGKLAEYICEILYISLDVSLRAPCRACSIVLLYEKKTKWNWVLTRPGKPWYQEVAGWEFKHGFYWLQSPILQSNMFWV